MARKTSKEPTIDLPQLTVDRMLQVIDIIRMAQRAKRGELVSIKAGLDAAFGDDWKNFKPPMQEVATCQQEVHPVSPALEQRQPGAESAITRKSRPDDAK
jgi:hypothetical protein